MRKLKGIVALILVLTVYEISFMNTPLDVMAETLTEQQLEKEYKENHTLDYFLEEEAAESTGIIEENLEIQLNLQGVFDSEIECLTEDEVELIENAEDIYVYNEYVGIYENGGATENEETSFEEQILSEKEINEVIKEVIKEVYYSEDEDEDSILCRIGKSVGIIPTDVYAIKSGVYNGNSTSCLKRSFLVFEFDSYVYVKCINEWLTMPNERYTDIVNYSWSGATRFDPNDSSHKCSANLYYERNVKGYSDGVQVVNYKEDYTVDYSGKINKNNNFTETALSLPFDLPKNYSCTTSSDTVTKLKFTVSIYLKKSGKELGLGYNYQHQKKKIDGWSAAVAVAGMTITVIGGIINATYPIMGKILVSAGIVTDIKNARSIAVASYNQVGDNTRFLYQYK